MAELQFDPDISNGAGAKPPDRRRYPRLKCQLPTEIRPAHSSFPMQGETTDVSLGGCYVATMFPMPVGTTIDFRCWVAATPIACKAIVRTADPGVGNGIEFLDLDGLSRTVLARHLDSLQANHAEINEPTGVIHPRA